MVLLAIHREPSKSVAARHVKVSERSKRCRTSAVKHHCATAEHDAMIVVGAEAKLIQMRRPHRKAVSADHDRGDATVQYYELVLPHAWRSERAVAS